MKIFDLSSVQDDAGLAKLPTGERTSWQKLWITVRELHERSKGEAGENPAPSN